MCRQYENNTVCCASKDDWLYVALVDVSAISRTLVHMDNTKFTTSNTKYMHEPLITLLKS